MAESGMTPKENDNSNELKLKLKQKLEQVKSKLSQLNKDLCTNIDSQRKKISLGYDSYIKNLKNESHTYIKEKEKAIKNKDILSYEYSKFINDIKELEKFNKNLSDIIVTSLDNYNNFLLYKLPYYKESASYFMINNCKKLANNNIFSKINKNQMNKIINEIENKSIVYLINGKYPLNINFAPSNNTIEDKTLLESIAQYGYNQIELNYLKDEEFKLIFNKDNCYEKNKTKQQELIAQNCIFKKIDISAIPYDLINLKIINSRIYSSVFDKIKFNNLISLTLDNCNLDSDHFENIFKSLLRRDNGNFSNSLKKLSAINNQISRIIKNEEIKRLNNKFNSLEILNLSNNYINDVNILEYIPNIKILDLSNNSMVQEYKCKQLIKNCKGFVILIRNIGIMKDPLHKTYRDYYINNLEKNNNSIYSINFESLFYKRNYDNILNINFTNLKKNINIFEINFSSCNIDDNSMVTLLHNCISINNNIRKLNLSFNLLTENIIDLLIKDNIDILLNKLVELDLSFNPIQFKDNKKYISDNAKRNHFVILLSHLPNLEIFSMKTTPFEETINEYLKKEVNIYYEKEKKHNVITKLEGKYLEIKDIIYKNHLNINDNFCLSINYLLTAKYTKRVKYMQHDLLMRHIIIDNII